MTDYNDLWELDRGDYVNIINELRAELDQARVQLAGCLCAAEGTGDADKVKQGDYAWTPALQKAVELRAALAEAERDLKKLISVTAQPWTCTHCHKGELVIGRSGSDYEVMCGACRTVVTTCYDEGTASRYVKYLLGGQAGKGADNG